MKCFKHHKQNKVNCEIKKCKYWINDPSNKNCCLILAEKKEYLTLEEIGKIFNVTRMRICQIEKQAIKKIRELIL